MSIDVALSAAKAVAVHGLHQSHHLPKVPLDLEQWTALLVFVRQQRLQALLSDAIESSVFAATDWQREQARNEAWASTVEVMALDAMLVRSLDALDGVADVRLLKGPALANLLYPRPELRLYGDIDLLIPAGDLDEALVRLTEAGWWRPSPPLTPSYDRRFAKTICIADGMGRQLDVHRTLVRGPFGYWIDLDELWAGSQLVEVASRTVATLDHSRHFLNVCYHAVLGSKTPRLLPLRDVAQALQASNLDPDEVIRLARSWRSQIIVLHAIRLVHSVLGVSVRSPVADWASCRPPTDQRLALFATTRLRSGSALMQLASAAALPTWHDRGAFVRATVAPQPAYLAARGLRRFGWLRASRRRAHRDDP